MMLAIGQTATATLTVEDKHLASALIQESVDGFPPVFATAQMIGLMETAASRVMHPLLGEGELSVGVTVNIIHSAPTLRGDTVTATATFTGMDGKFYCFDIRAEDGGGEIGNGTHKRALVSQERLLSGAKKRASNK